jgi:hypothetical protein
VSEYLPPVVVELEGRDAQLRQTLTAAKAEVRKFATDVGKMNATVKVKADLAAGEIEKIQRRIGAIRATIKVGLRVDEAAAQARLDRFTRDRAINANVGVRLDLAAGEIQKIQQQIGKIKATIKVGLRLDDAATITRLDHLTRDRTVTITTNTVGGGPTTPTPGNGGQGGAGGGGRDALQALLLLSPALLPIAAQATALAASVGAATVAVGAFGLAIISQLSALGDAADAEKKYKEAVDKSGATSQQAAKAQEALSRTLSKMPPQTRQAAGAYMVLKDSFKAWSDDMAQFTMVPVARSFALVQAILPKLSPMVEGTSLQFARLVAVAGGAVSSPGFDALMSKFTAFANGALKAGVDHAIHFFRVMSEGGGSGAFSEFMAYAKANGPLVSETLHNLGDAVMNVLKAASEAGPGLLTLINAAAKLVAALPPSLVATLLQLGLAIKLIGLTSGATTAITGLAGRFTALRATALAAGGGLAGLRAAFLSLSVAARATVIIAVIAAIGVAVAKLSSLGQQAPPDIDKLTNSLGRLGENGQVKGEALRAFGANLNGLRDSIKSFAAPAVIDNIQQGIVKVLTAGTTDSTPVKEAKQNLDAIDKSLANLVQNGNADLAASALEKMKAAYAKGGHDVTNFTKNLDEYKKAVDDAKFAQELTAQSMGLFGEQALATKQKLDAQKQSADGLAQSINAVSDASLTARGGIRGMEAALDAADAAFKKNGKTLDENTAKGRGNNQALDDIAASTIRAAESARANGASWETVNGIYDRGHAKILKLTQGVTGNETAAKKLADQILKTPNKTARIKMEKEDAVAGLNAFNAALKKAPGAKSVTLKTLSASAEKVLESFGFKVTHLKDGSVKITAVTGKALSAIKNVQGAVDNLHGKSIGIGVYTTEYYKKVQKGIDYTAPIKANGGLVRGYADGGNVQSIPDGGYVQGPGTGTSDSILAMFGSGAMARISDSEYVVRAAAVRKYGVQVLDALNSGRLKLAGFARGGPTAAEKQARSQMSSQFGISRFGQAAGYQNTSFQKALSSPGSLGDLVSALNGLRGQIKAAFSGRTESSLLKQLDKAGKSLITYEKQLTKVTSSLASAKTKLDDLKNSAAQLKSSVASSILSGSSVVTQAPQEGFGLTSQDVVNQMAAQLQKTQQFSAQLETLKKRGLSADLLQQIAAAGIDQGGATAAALVGANDATLKQLNDMQSKMKSSATAAGSAIADAMYGAGIKAADGLVKGLQKQQKAIEAQMLKIATSMQKAIKKALGIKSPSTVMAKLGDFTALGFAQGIGRSSKHAVIAARGLAMSVQQGAALTGSPTLAGMSLAGSGGPMVVHQHYHAHVTVEGHVMTERNLRDVVEKQMVQLGARNSVTYQQYRR